jgi:hypothetical protein
VSRDSRKLVNGKFRGKFGRNSWFEDVTGQMIGGVTRVSPIRESRNFNNLVEGRPLQSRPQAELEAPMSRKSHATTWLWSRAAKLVSAIELSSLLKEWNHRHD